MEKIPLSMDWNRALEKRHWGFVAADSVTVNLPDDLL